jgi:hypothetical protein
MLNEVICKKGKIEKVRVFRFSSFPYQLYYYFSDPGPVIKIYQHYLLPCAKQQFTVLKWNDLRAANDR